MPSDQARMEFDVPAKVEELRAEFRAMMSGAFVCLSAIADEGLEVRMRGSERGYDLAAYRRDGLLVASVAVPSRDALPNGVVRLIGKPVGGTGPRGARHRCPWRVAADNSLKPHSTHQPCHGAARHRDAAASDVSLVVFFGWR